MRKTLIIIALVVTAVATYGLTKFRTASPAEQNFSTMRISREPLVESTVATGVVRSMVGAEVKVGSQVSGVLAKLYANVGDSVKKGDLLATLDDSERRARINALRADLVAAIAEAEYAKIEVQRYEKSDVALIQVDSSRRNAAVRAAAVEQVRARLAEAEVQLGYTRITAPVAGTIASVSTYQGETVAASLQAPTFVTIVDLSRLEIQAYVDETDIGRVHVGQDVTFRVDAYPSHELSGAVRAIYPKAQIVNNVVTYLVTVDITNHEDLLIRPDMTAHVNFVLARVGNALTAPRTALLRENGTTFVVARSGESWQRKPVKTGLQTAQRIEIVGGVQEGDMIVSDAQQWLQTRAEAAQ